MYCARGWECGCGGGYGVGFGELVCLAVGVWFGVVGGFGAWDGGAGGAERLRLGPGIGGILEVLGVIVVVVWVWGYWA